MKPAPTHLWNPSFCGEMDLVIRKDGVWVHEGSPIRRKELINLFASILCIKDDGYYYLISPQEKIKVKVDQYPFLVTERGDMPKCLLPVGRYNRLKRRGTRCLERGIVSPYTPAVIFQLTGHEQSIAIDEMVVKGHH